jgi:hypothetical protein
MKSIYLFDNPYDEGREACLSEFESEPDCPYPVNSKEYSDFANGFWEEEDKREKAYHASHLNRGIY